MRKEKCRKCATHISIKHTHIFISNKCTQSPTLTYLSNKYTHTHTHSHSHSHTHSASCKMQFAAKKVNASNNLGEKQKSIGSKVARSPRLDKW